MISAFDRSSHSLNPRRFILSLGLLCGSMAAPSVTTAADAARVNFTRDVQPILANNCFKCHGPDAAERQGGLRLDVPAGATAAAE